MAVLANSDEPLTGYRVAKIAGLPREKIYPQLRKGREAGLVTKSQIGFLLSDPDVRTLLRKRIRINWSDDWFAGEKRRAVRAKESAREGTNWFDDSRYTPNPVVAALYATEIERPAEKGDLARQTGRGLSRKSRRTKG